MTKKLKRCKACQRPTQRTDHGTPGLCGNCSCGFKAKVAYVTPKRYSLPADETSDEELMALVSMNSNAASAAIMDKRIERITAEIQAGWTDQTRERRSVAKKKHESKVHSYASSAQGRFRVYEATSVPRI